MLEYFLADKISPDFLTLIISHQLTSIFRGGGTTLLRESIGNAVFFSTYEHVRYYMHLRLRDYTSNPSHFIDVGVGIVSGGIGGIAVSVTINKRVKRVVKRLPLVHLAIFTSPFYLFVSSLFFILIFKHVFACVSVGLLFCR